MREASVFDGEVAVECKVGERNEKREGDQGMQPARREQRSSTTIASKQKKKKKKKRKYRVASKQCDCIIVC